jgi:hypothetical protein
MLYPCLQYLSSGSPSGFFTRMMLVRALGRVFSSLLPTPPTAPTLGVSPPSVPSEELVVGGEELVEVL